MSDLESVRVIELEEKLQKLEAKANGFEKRLEKLEEKLIISRRGQGLTYPTPGPW